MFIKLSNITKTYGEGTSAFRALKGVNLEINKGDFIALMGPSGSGKSTMANILGCLDIATSGEYLFENVSVFKLTRNERALYGDILSALFFKDSISCHAPPR